ncbi:MAG: GNAT family N-acetyltransferase [Nitrospiraceae bacterium]
MTRARSLTIDSASRTRTRAEGEKSLDAALPRGGRLSVLTSLEALAGLEGGGRRLEENHLRPHQIFQSYDWVRTWSETYISPGSGSELAVVAGYRDGDLVFVWPLVKERQGPFRVLRWLSEPLAQYGDILASPGQCPVAWTEAAIELLRREGGADILRLRHVREDATAFPLIARRFRSSHLTERAPFLDLSAFDSEASYEHRYTPTQRRRRKKIRKAITSDLGEISFETVPAGPACDAAIARALDEKCQWLEERGRRGHSLRATRLHSFLTEYAAKRGGLGSLVVTRLAAGDRDLAWEIGLRAGGTHFAFITSHVNALTDY